MDLFDIAVARKLSGSGGGGGGSSDFSTAEVTIVNTCSEWGTSYAYCAYGDDPQYGGYSMSSGTIRLNPSQSQTLSIITYKGNTVIPLGDSEFIGSSVSCTTSGDVEYIFGALFISGNGTVTFADI